MLMGLEIPPEIPSWVVAAVAGPWPEGDEDALRRLGHAWTEIGDAVARAAELSGEARYRAAGAIEGQTAEALKRYGIDLDNGLNSAAKACYGLAEQCFNDALQTEYSKYVIIGSLAALVVQLAIDAFVPGFGQVHGAAATAATRLTVRAAFRELITNLGTDAARAAAARLVKTILFKGVTLGAIQGGLIPFGAEAVQMFEGNREAGEFNWDQIGLGVVAGAAAGGVGEFVGVRTMMGLERRFFSNSAPGFLGRAGVRFAGAGAGGAAGAVAGVVSLVPFTGELDMGWDHILPGVVGGVLGTMPHALRGPAGPAVAPRTDGEGGPRTGGEPESGGGPGDNDGGSPPADPDGAQQLADDAEAAGDAAAQAAAVDVQAAADQSLQQQQQQQQQSGADHRGRDREAAAADSKAAPQSKVEAPQQQMVDRPGGADRDAAPAQGDRSEAKTGVGAKASPETGVGAKAAPEAAAKAAPEAAAKGGEAKSAVSAPRVDPREIPKVPVDTGPGEGAGARVQEQTGSADQHVAGAKESHEQAAGDAVQGRDEVQARDDVVARDEAQGRDDVVSLVEAHGRDEVVSLVEAQGREEVVARDEEQAGDVVLARDEDHGRDDVVARDEAQGRDDVVARDEAQG
ncbi:hypothetical protein, partial [Nocardia wallacei]|uniref:WXG100-like domain-containing protein n=1 Tax=Nocardia wallacei TaxID=480035 RepID=UPI002458AD79